MSAEALRGLVVVEPDGRALPGFVQGQGLHNLRQLVVMRNVAIVGQTVTILVTTQGLDIPLPLPWMWAVIATLGLFNLLTWHSLTRPGRHIGDAEMAMQLLVDVAALTLLLALSGGATNPFVGMFVLPLAITAACLPWTYTWLVALATVSCYSLLAYWYQPLLEPADTKRHLQLLVAGMWTNYAITAGMVAHFLTRLGAELRRSQRIDAAARERELESEHLTRIGTLAAGAAHELAQPLSTIKLMVGQLEHGARGNPEFERIAAAMVDQLKHCQDTLSALLSYGRQTIDSGGDVESLEAFTLRSIAAFAGRRPHARVRFAVASDGNSPQMRHDLALRQALVNLLNNAADASREPIEVTLRWDEQQAYLSIRDHGEGLTPEALQKAGKLFFTTKAPGVGNGLGPLLAHTGVQRLGGSLQLSNADGGGAVARVTLPLEGLYPAATHAAASR